ncbi:hypothetical protein GLOIN_2v1782831 [Rhizophagus clarus]|uniref:SAM domain-containing protein n=1 Tax=Rhizophagus clarus TaxID=94130 RepID=A0A8H3LS70_9GLOM|nr:hypothetical protein GLOIN_2v1782831 [Rhizophagus clarus]
MAVIFPDDVRKWSPEHVKKYLENHVSSSVYNEDDIKKINEQNVHGKAFLRLTETILTNENGPFKIKFGSAIDIIELVEKLVEKQATSVLKIKPQSSEKIKPSKALFTCNHNVINSTVTLALYTLVIYFFGIITSVFVLDNNLGKFPYSESMPDSESLPESWTMRSAQIILYWIDTLLNDSIRVPTGSF